MSYSWINFMLLTLPIQLYNYAFKFLHSYTFSRNFLITNVPFYGNCFAFNTVYKNNRSKEKKSVLSSISGPSFGLNIILALDQRNYMKNGITEQVNEIKNIYYVSLTAELDGKHIHHLLS